MYSVRQKYNVRFLLFMASMMIVLVTVYLFSLPARDPKWIAVGNLIKILSPDMYSKFKMKQQAHRLHWFDNLAQDNTTLLHVASGYTYMSEKEYNSMLDNVLQEMPIKGGDSVYELGVGTGAAIKRIRDVYGISVSVGGSDISIEAIKRVSKVFANEQGEFHVASMTKKDDSIEENSKDHVISIGALAMYLYIDEMEKALKEALRIAKPGGHLCFTHFIEPNGMAKGSILEPVKKSFWFKMGEKYKLKDLKVKQMIYYKDRYYVCFSK